MSAGKRFYVQQIASLKRREWSLKQPVNAWLITELATTRGEKAGLRLRARDERKIRRKAQRRARVVSRVR